MSNQNSVTSTSSTLPLPITNKPVQVSLPSVNQQPMVTQQQQPMVTQQQQVKKSSSVLLWIFNVILIILIIGILFGIGILIYFISKIKNEEFQQDPVFQTCKTLPSITLPSDFLNYTLSSGYQPSVAESMINLCLITDHYTCSNSFNGNNSKFTSVKIFTSSKHGKVSCIVYVNIDTVYVCWTYLPLTDNFEVNQVNPTYSTLFTSTDLVNQELLEIFLGARIQVNNYLKTLTGITNILVTGHSYGGNLATFHLLDITSPIVPYGYIFGNIRIGNDSFVNNASTRFNIGGIYTVFFIYNLADSMIDFPQYSKSLVYNHMQIGIIPFSGTNDSYQSYLDGVNSCLSQNILCSD